MNSCFEKYKIAIYDLLSLNEVHQKSKNDNSNSNTHDNKKKHVTSNHEIKKKNNCNDSNSVNNTKSSINISYINGNSYEGREIIIISL